MPQGCVIIIPEDKIMNVYFRDSYGKRRLLEANVKDKEAVWKIIQKFLDDHNYKSYYTRVWYNEGYTWYDVGSHTEYFLVDENMMEQYENEQEEEKTVYRTAQRNKEVFGYQPE